MEVLRLGFRDLVAIQSGLVPTSKLASLPAIIGHNTAEEFELIAARLLKKNPIGIRNSVIILTIILVPKSMPQVPLPRFIPYERIRYIQNHYKEKPVMLRL